jgi:hypothetical protein
VLRASLVLDGGAGGTQRLSLSSATVNDNTFTPTPSSALSATCVLPTATIKITKTDDTSTGGVNEPISIQPSDNNSTFRTVDCKYMYNLATSSLTGVGTYKLYAVIGSVSIDNPATFDLK